MADTRVARSTPRYLLWAAYVAASVIGAAYGFVFGERIGGILLGVVTALNGAVFCAFMVGAIAERIARLAARTRAGRPDSP
jgi:hypothetical protein